MSTPVLPTCTEGKLNETVLLSKLDPGTRVTCAVDCPLGPMATVEGETFNWNAMAAVTAVLTVIECVRLALAPWTVMAPLPTAAAADAETPTIRGSEGEATKGG